MSRAGWSSRYEPNLDRWVFRPPPERRSVLVYADGRVIVSDDVMRTIYPRTVADPTIIAEIFGSGDAP